MTTPGRLARTTKLGIQLVMPLYSIAYSDAPNTQEAEDATSAVLTEAACHCEHRDALEATLFSRDARDELILELDRGELRPRKTRV
jgi:hypothetical protein